MTIALSGTVTIRLPLPHSLSSLFLPKDKHTFSLTDPVPPGTVFLPFYLGWFNSTYS